MAGFSILYMGWGMHLHSAAAVCFYFTVFTAGTRRLFLLYPRSRVEDFSGQVSSRVMDRNFLAVISLTASLTANLFFYFRASIPQNAGVVLFLDLDFMHPFGAQTETISPSHVLEHPRPTSSSYVRQAF